MVGDGVVADEMEVVMGYVSPKRGSERPGRGREEEGGSNYGVGLGCGRAA